MGKTKELNMVIEELRSAAATISDAADMLTVLLGGASSEKAKTTAKPELTLEAVRAVLADKSRKGHTAEIRELLKKYGAEKLSQVNPASYKALLAEAEVLDDGK